jgi:hypothetical protein
MPNKIQYDGVKARYRNLFLKDYFSQYSIFHWPFNLAGAPFIVTDMIARAAFLRLGRQGLLQHKALPFARIQIAGTRGFSDRVSNNGDEEISYDLKASDEVDMIFHTAYDVWEGNDLPEIKEKFENPLWWETDFPAGFDDEMKHEVEMMQVFEDLVPMFDTAWESEIHPLLDGSKITMKMNVPLEDFDNLLFLDDQTTFDTKVVMEVPLSCLKLDEQAMQIFIELCGPRYNKNKKHVKISEDRYDKRIYNHKRLCVILRDLIATSVSLSKEKNKE